MSGIELRDGVLTVGRDPNALDELAIDFSRILDDLAIEHAYVAGYVTILAGRSRATEDIDVFVERLDASRVEELTDRLEDEGYWGPAMPLDDAYEMLAGGDNVWVAPHDDIVPHLEVKFPSDEYDQASIHNSITARIGDAELPVGPLELQIAYKLYLGDETSFEDAVHLHSLFGESLSTGELERWVRKLGVEDLYDRLGET